MAHRDGDTPMPHRLFALLLALSMLPPAIPATEPVKLEYAPASVGNPLKGLVPYSGEWKDRFPHTMEFNYLYYGDLVQGFGEYQWKPLETLLNDIASRGHQAVVRVAMEYPGKKNILPKFLVDGGLKVHKYINTNTQPEPPAEIETPDYEDANLRRSLKEFIAAFGAKYDGDPRLAFITAGLLGTWGEWHTYPRDDLFASKAVQDEVMEAYTAAFKSTPVLLRYPAGAKNPDGRAENDNRPFGYHDDSFAWATLHTGKKDTEWFFMSSMKVAGPKAVAKWQMHPIGGEIRPEAWGQVFDAKPKNPQVQNFAECVKATHASWLLDSGMFEKKQTKARLTRATEQVRRMGYEFHIPEVLAAVAADALTVKFSIENRGVAPFYYPWPLEFALATGKDLKHTFKSNLTLQGILPEEKPKALAFNAPLKDVPTGTYALLVRVPNTLQEGAPVRFANATQDRNADGWLTLCDVVR